MDPQPTQPQGMFSGRLNRVGYFLIVVYVFAFFGIFLTIAYSFPGHNGTVKEFNAFSVSVGLISILFTIPIGIGAGIRRWHDLNQSGWLILLNLLPFVGFISTIILLFVPGTKGPNQYGDPDSSASTPKKVLFGKRN